MVNNCLTGNVSTVLSKFKWVIDNFCIGCKNVGDCFKSPDFTMNLDGEHTRWCIELYPKNKNEENKDYFALYIYMYSKKQIRANLTFEIMNGEGNCMFTETLKETTFTGNWSGWGFPQFVPRNIIVDPANNIIQDDKIIIMCAITASDGREVVNKEATSNEEPEDTDSSILQRLAEMDKYEVLINDEKFSDISLMSEGKEVKGHKCILAKSSTIFARMFDTDMKEKQCNIVEITDIKYDVLVELLRYIYSGNVNNIDILAGELAEAADKYAVDGLKKICEKAMCKNLNIDDALLCLNLADRCQMDKLKKKEIEFIITHADDIINQEEFGLLPSKLMSEICRALVLKNKC